MNPEPDLLVLGAGPAGVGAALAAADCGLSTVLLDAAPAAGGQVYRAPPAGFAIDDADGDRLSGERLRRRLAHSPVDTAFGRTVWSVGQDFRVDALGPGGPEHWRPRTLLVAAGASERVTPFPGWTLPGVIGLAAATLLLKSQYLLPGRRVLVAGCGPLLAAVAYRIVRYGGEVVAVTDLAGRGDWLRRLPALTGRPADLRRGLSWRRQVHAAGVPWLYRRTVRSLTATELGFAADIGAVDAQGAPLGDSVARLEADCVAVGHGLVPATDITRLLHARHVFDRVAGGWRPQLDADQRTSRRGLYAAGDGCGIRGAAAAYQAGRIAGFAAALDLGRITAAAFRLRTRAPRRRLAGAARFGRAMAALMAQRPALVRAIDADTIVCRCEDLTRGELDAALAQGAADVNQLKSWTRCGMGPCQGRVCGDTVAELVAAYRSADRERAGLWTPRVPLRPLDLEALTGEFGYADIPLPSAAPP